MKCHVTYKTPTYTELEKQFDWIWSEYKTAKFERHETCKNIDETDGEREFEYVHMNREASTEKALAEIDKQGYRPATFEELVSFTAAYPDEQKKHDIVALGSPFASSAGRRLVPCLPWDGGKRDLSADWLDRDWNSDDRFLVLRKVSGTRTLGNLDAPISLGLLIRACKAFVKVLEEGKI